MLKGIPASPGIAMGKAFLFHADDLTLPKRKIKDEELQHEIERLEDALLQTRKEISEIQDRISKEMGSEHGDIFNAHILVLEDKAFIGEVTNKLKQEKIGIEWVFSEVLRQYIRTLSQTPDEYFKERAIDVQDVGRRVLRNLLGQKGQSFKDLREPVIIVARDLSPSDTATMRKEKVRGFITDVGGRTSHTAIMARALEIPAVVGLESATKEIQNGDHLVIDGSHGIVVVNPDPDTIEKYRREALEYEQFEKELFKLSDLPCETLDGRRIELSANIELPDELPSILAHGAEGIGLYRTEYFYMNREGLPTEEEHYEAYKYVASRVAPHPVIIRTMDLGGDKFFSQLDVPREINPFLGWRGIRLTLAMPEIFRAQLRAIFRASAHGNLKIMFPMISGIDELRQANKFVADVKEELSREGVPFNPDIEVGIMIEVPSAALTADVLAKETDFFSIGTNDLIQYSVAVDRINERVAYLYEPSHLAILRLISQVIKTGHDNGIWVGMCGEMASEPLLVPLLLGLGIDELSTSAVVLPEIKRITRSISFHQAQEIVRQALRLNSGKEIEEFLQIKCKELMPEIFR